MNQTETQVVKIHLGDNKQTSSFIYTLADSIEETGVEIYLVCELPLFNPAASNDCQKIAEAIAGSLRRSYSKAGKINIFENALSAINEELGKLINIGKTHWLGKLNAIVAAKQNDILSISSVGKVSSLLYRDNEFVSVSESTNSTQHLKTFENFSEGKLRLGDILVLSTSQLFNHISADRIKKLLSKSDLPTVADTVINLLQDELGPDVACATIFAAQVEAGSIVDEEVELQQYLDNQKIEAPSTMSQVKQLVPTKTWESLGTAKKISQNIWQDVYKKYLKPSYWKSLVNNSGKTLQVVQNRLSSTASKVKPSTVSNNISNYSKQKKIFFASALILLIVLGANITINKIKSNKNNTIAAYDSQISNIEKLINDSNAALLYDNQSQAGDLYNQIKDLLNLPEDKLSSEQLSKYQSLKSQADELNKKITKTDSVDVSEIGSLSNSNNLINLSNYLATETNRTIVSYNKTTKKIEDNTLKLSESVVASVALQNNLAAVYTGNDIVLWSPSDGIIKGRFSDNLPSKNDFGGITTYSTNNKVYFIDKNSGEVKSLAPSSTGFSNLTTSFSDPRLKSANSIAIDSNIYFISGGKVIKFNSGKEQTFNAAVSNLPDSAKIYTSVGAQRIYILNPQSKQLTILNKDGTLVKSISSDKFSDLKDFAIDEKNNTAYILSGTSLLKVSL